ncbi:MAG TPA: hypothetical protein VLF62_02295 [Candidatus Saccharimonadales bacterium]|nr:hypothetical protein [Candidatus Saccharimonadales bacterium]
MNQNIALIIALAVPVVVFVGLRVNASLVFLSLCLGAVLVQYVGSEANELIRLVSPHAGSVSDSTVKFALLLAPAAITGIVTVFSVHGKLKNIVNVLPSVAAASLFVLLAVPALPPGLAHSVQAQQSWHYLSNSQSLVVAAGALVSLGFLWTQRSLFQHHDKRRK